MNRSKPTASRLLLTLGLCSLVTAAGAQTTLAPSDTAVTDNLDPANVGATAALSGVNGGVTGELVIRERRSAGQNDRRISSYIYFDLTEPTAAAALDVPLYDASLTLEYVGQLNTVNGGTASLGRVTTAAWDSTTNFPLHSYGFDAAIGAATAADVTPFIANVAAEAATGQTLTIDVTNIVRGWDDGTHPNFGFVVFFNQLESQGAGFNNPQLVITIPDDSDGDGMPDDYEIANGLDPGVNDAAIDNDTEGGADGLTNLEEYNAGTNPQDSDSDNDGLLDGQEVKGTPNPYQTDTPGDAATVAPGMATDALVADSDNDGLTDFEELDNANGFVTNPNTDDTDGDLLNDSYEIASALDPTDAAGDNGGAGDPDMDTLTNAEEQAAGTDPNDDDTDDDTLTDGAEVITHLTSPFDADTDGDHLSDSEEIAGGVTSPLVADSDTDGFLDGVEVAAGSDPNVFGSTPTLATITWSVEALDEEADLLTDGALLYAENLNGPAATVNGIPFSSAIDNFGTRTAPNFVTGTEINAGGAFFYLDQDPALSPLLESIWTGGTDRTVSIFGLTPGTNYAVQVGRADDRDTGSIPGRYILIDGFGGENAAEPVGPDNTIFGGSANPALLFTGLFTAAASVQSFEVEQLLPGAVAPSTVINFIQVREAEPRSIKFTAVSADRAAGTVTLTWESEEDDIFAAFFSLDGSDWEGELDDSIGADAGTTTTRTFQLAPSGLEDEPTILFRVQLQPTG